MNHVLRWFCMLVLVIFIMSVNGYALIGPIRVLPSGNVLLVPSDEIKLSEEHIDLYHHPLGIWLVEYRALLKNLRPQEIMRPVGFPAGFDIRLIEGDLSCDRFENFKVFIDDQQLSGINSIIKCSNYVETTGTRWSADDGSGVGFLNTWELKFKPDEKKWIKVTFCFIVKKVPPIYNPAIKDSWYVDLLNWLKQDYAMREENNFQLPLSIGSFWAFYPDSTIIRTHIADEWSKVFKISEQKYQQEMIKRYEFSEPIGFYSPPHVPFDTLTINQIQTMSPTELILLRNSFFAKYGKSFQNATLRKYFTAQPWYSETPGYQDWYLTQWDINNIKLISEFETSKKDDKAASGPNN
jgi:hypothetical protein